jgi:lipoprotein NlpI
MSLSRLDQLLEFYKQDPDDPFNVYALAIEYIKRDAAEAQRYFDLLLAQHASYLPTYYHAAKFYQEAGDTAKATTIYEKGIALARTTGAHKALRELQSAYNEMTFE